jgi:hypothetical protein
MSHCQVRETGWKGTRHWWFNQAKVPQLSSGTRSQIFWGSAWHLTGCLESPDRLYNCMHLYRIIHQYLKSRSMSLLMSHDPSTHCYSIQPLTSTCADSLQVSAPPSVSQVPVIMWWDSHCCSACDLVEKWFIGRRQSNLCCDHLMNSLPRDWTCWYLRVIQGFVRLKIGVLSS